MTRVLELAHLFPGPLVGRLLAQGGCDVLKIEPPEGDPARRLPPYIEGTGFAFWAANAGKRCVALDLATDEGVDRLRALAVEADVVLDGFRPGVLERWLDPVALADDGRVVVRLSGHGQESPEAQERGHDLTYATRAGVTWLQDGRVGVPLADVAGALWATSETWRALAQGGGRVLDVSLTGSARLFSVLLAWYGRAGGELPEGNPLHGGVPWYGVYACRDGEVAIGALEPELWVEAGRALGLEPDADAEDIAAALADRSADEVLSSLEGAGVGAAVVGPPDLDRAWGADDPVVTASTEAPELKPLESVLQAGGVWPR